MGEKVSNVSVNYGRIVQGLGKTCRNGPDVVQVLIQGEPIANKLEMKVGERPRLLAVDVSFLRNPASNTGRWAYFICLLERSVLTWMFADMNPDMLDFIDGWCTSKYMRDVR